MQEESEIAALVTSIDPSALPLVIVIIALGYLYFKFKQIRDDRFETKLQRDADSQNIHDMILKHTFQIDQLNGNSQHHEEILEDLRSQLNILNTNIAKLSVTIEGMNKK